MPHRLAVTALCTAAIATTAPAVGTAAAPAEPPTALPAPKPVPVSDPAARPGLPALPSLAGLPGRRGDPTLTDPPDRLTITIKGNGAEGGDRRAINGTYRLECHPTGGTHWAASAACARLDEVTRQSRDPFIPVPSGSNCTMVHGGPATAHITGTWAGHPVNARFDRRNGCEIARWDRLRPILPDARF